MKDTIDADTLMALKIGFSYMPKAIEVNKYQYGDRYQAVLAHIESVKQALLVHGVDPDEVYGEIHADISPKSTY